MKKTKVKKIKKIPKYGEGASYIPAGLQKDFNLLFNAPQGMNVNNVLLGSVANAAQQANTYGGYSNTRIPSGLTTGANELIKSTFGVDQNSTAAVMADSTAQGAELGMSVGGPWGALYGAAAGFTLGALKSDRIDYSKISTTSDIADSYVAGGIFRGGNKNELLRDAAQYLNSLLATELTSHLQEKWANDPRNQRAVLNVKDGGVVPGEHYASRLEVETDSDGNNAVRYAWDSKGKDTYHVYTNPDGSSAEGNMIFNEEGVKRPNGMKYSDTAEKIIKNIKDPKLRKISLKKLAAEQEIEKAKEGKTKNGIPAYGGGDDGKKELDMEIAARKMAQRSLDDYFIHRMKDGTFVLQDINGGRYPIPEIMLLGIKQADNGGYYFDFTQTGISPSAGKWNGNMNFAKQILNSKNVAKLRNTLTKVLPKGSKAATSTKALDVAKAEVTTERAIAEQQRLMSQAWLRGKTTGNSYAGATTGRDVASQGLWNLPNSATNADNILISEGIKSSMPYYLTLAGMLGGAATFLSSEYVKNNPDTEDPRHNQNITGVSKLNINETNSGDTPPLNTETDQNTQGLQDKAEEISTPSSGKRRRSKNSGNGRSITLPTVELDPVNIDGRVKINGDGSNYALYDPNRTDKLEFDFSKPIEVPIEGEVRTSPTFEAMLKNTNWEDFAYKAASVLTPLLDREKAEKVTLSRPTWKGIPVGVDVLKQLQDAQLGYDMSNYNTTQGGYAAGQQLAARMAAADNLARQRAAIHTWQTQQQNENIAKNIASYNDHTRLLSEINDREADMNAANRGAARNINRQNRSQAFKNIGQILIDKKQYDMDLIRTEILKPMIESVYENSDVVIPMLNKQIKKKSTKKSKGE